MFQLVITTLDWFGVAVFAVTGALVASRKQMDIFGFALLATVTGIGGGSVRDLLLGRAGVLGRSSRFTSRSASRCRRSCSSPRISRNRATAC